MNRGHLLAAFLCLGAIPLYGQLDQADDATQAKCAEYLNVPLPEEAKDIPAPKSWPQCDSYKSYSGLGRKVDYAVARKCAWTERLAQKAELEPRFTTASVFGGSAMLTVLYANGQGVEKNIPLALHFACEWGWAPAEFSGRIEHLEKMRDDPSSTDLFGYCDDITSGFMEGYCSAYDKELADQARIETLKKIAASFTPIQHEAFEKLQQALEAYAEAHARGEIDLSRTARAMYQINAEQTLRANFLAAIQSFESSKFPAGTKASYADVDAQLNSTYQAALKNADQQKSEYGAVQPDGIRNAERAWMAYRDAWVAFAKLRYPSVPEEAWLTLLTKDRTSILDGSYCDMDEFEGKCAWQGDTWKPSPLP